MLATELTIFCLITFLFLIVGLIGGWELKSYLVTTTIPNINPLHPECFDTNGDIIRAEVLSISIHPGMYEDFQEEYGSLFDEDDDTTED